MALALSLLIVLVASVPAEAAKLRRGLYDCNGTEDSYVASVKIKDGGKYLYANARKGSRLKNPSKGRYSVSGKKIKWLSGTFKRSGYVSTIYVTPSSPKGYFSLDRKSNGTWTGISCYWRAG
jgi:hypothetical protein